MDMNQPALTTLYAYLTSGCNCACRHCWFVPDPSLPGRADTVLVPDQLRRVIEQALPLGLTSIKWTGGEPTFHPRFPDFLAMQREFGLTGSIETNGMLVDAELAAGLRESGVHSVSVSLDGAEAATHDAIRGVKGGFERTCRGIRALVAAGYRPEIILTLQRANLAELPELFTLANELGAGAVKLNVLQPVLRGQKLAQEGEALAVNEILEVARSIEAAAEKHGNIPIQLDVPMAFRPLSGVLSGENAGSCNIMHVLGILPSGQYALCGVGQHVPELAMGGIDEVELEKVWREHPILVRIRLGLPRKLQGVCSRCLMQSGCLGSCIASNYQLSGDLLAPYWFCRQADEAGLFPKQRLRPKKL